MDIFPNFFFSKVFFQASLNHKFYLLVNTFVSFMQNTQENNCWVLHPSGFLLCDPPALLNNGPILSPIFSLVIFIKTYTCFPLLFQAESKTKPLLFVHLTLYLIMFYLQHICRLLTSFLSSLISFLIWEMSSLHAKSQGSHLFWPTCFSLAMELLSHEFLQVSLQDIPSSPFWNADHCFLSFFSWR